MDRRLIELKEDERLRNIFVCDWLKKFKCSYLGVANALQARIDEDAPEETYKSNIKSVLELMVCCCSYIEYINIARKIPVDDEAVRQKYPLEALIQEVNEMVEIAKPCKRGGCSKQVLNFRGYCNFLYEEDRCRRYDNVSGEENKEEAGRL